MFHPCTRSIGSWNRHTLFVYLVFFTTTPYVTNRVRGKSHEDDGPACVQQGPVEDDVSHVPDEKYEPENGRTSALESEETEKGF